MSEPKKTESFAGNVMKYSIATYLGFGISGAALIIKLSLIHISEPTRH